MAQDLHETASATNKNQMQNCHASIQEHVEETLHTTVQFPCAKPSASLSRNLRDAGFKVAKSSQQTSFFKFKGRVLERPTYVLSIHLLCAI